MPNPIKQQTKNGICTLTLNRPEKRNAFDDALIAELINALKNIEEQPDIRVILLNAEGPHFCAGADLNWMQRMAEFSQKENEEDALKLAELLRLLNASTKPVIALAQGRTMGGGLGLLTCSDIVIATENAQFCFSEAKLGLIPATIAPYVIRSIGYSATRRYFISAELFDVAEAKQMGLVHQIVTQKNLMESAHALAKNIIQNGPQALAAIKNLLNQLNTVSHNDIRESAELLAYIRSSKEAKEGIRAFLNKHTPQWSSKDS